MERVIFIKKHGEFYKLKSIIKKLIWLVSTSNRNVNIETVGLDFSYGILVRFHFIHIIT